MCGALISDILAAAAGHFDGNFWWQYEHSVCCSDVESNVLFRGDIEDNALQRCIGGIWLVLNLKFLTPARPELHAL